MVFSDNTAPDALCLVYALEQWDVVENSVSHYWEGGLCGLQDVQDLSALNWDYVADWTPDFSLVAVADGDHVSISELSPYHEPETIIQTENRVTSVAWSPSAAYLLVTSVNQETSQTFVEVWDPLSGHRLLLYTLSAPLLGTTWSPNQRSIGILSGEDSDYSVSVVDVLSGETRFHLTQATKPNLLWRPDGNGLAVSSPTTIEIVSSTSGETSLTINADQVTGIAWHPWRNWLAYSTGNELVIYDVEAGEVVGSASSESNVVSWSPNGELLATLQSDQRIGIWQITESR
jgi:WD40 repeat protein